MPLLPGHTKHDVSENIKRELDAGKPHDQAIAIALSKAGMSNKQKHCCYGEHVPPLPPVSNLKAGTLDAIPIKQGIIGIKGV